MKKILFCFLFAYSVLVYADNKMTMNVNENDPSFVVTLPANPTTGFQWTVVRFDKDLLTLQGSSYERPKTNLIGAGGQMHFTFGLQKKKSYPDNTVIVLKYARSWEPNTATLKSVQVNFIKGEKK